MFATVQPCWIAEQQFPALLYAIHLCHPTRCCGIAAHPVVSLGTGWLCHLHTLSETLQAHSAKLPPESLLPDPNGTLIFQV